jgi:hypothetical protein
LHNEAGARSQPPEGASRQHRRAVGRPEKNLCTDRKKGGLVNDEALLLGLLQGGHDTILVDGADGRSGYAQRYPSILLRDVEALFLQVGVELTLGFVVGVRYVVAYAGTLAGQITNSGHDIEGLDDAIPKRAANIGKIQPNTKLAENEE